MSRVRTRGPNRSTNDDLIQVHPFHHRLSQSPEVCQAELPRSDIDAMHMEALENQTPPFLGGLCHHLQNPGRGRDASGHDGVVGSKVVHFDINVIA